MTEEKRESKAGTELEHDALHVYKVLGTVLSARNRYRYYQH